MQKTCALLVVFICSLSCIHKEKVSSLDPINWDKRITELDSIGSFKSGSTYLSIYSQIYSISELKTHDLTATVSMRNANKLDTIYIQKAQYYGTDGKLIRTYIDKTIFLKPMETLAIVINEADWEGGTGANFVFDWSVGKASYVPIFEGVMVSTSGQQGLSFTTQGKRLTK